MELKIGFYDMNISGQLAQQGNAVTKQHNQSQYQKGQTKNKKQFPNMNHIDYPC